MFDIIADNFSACWHNRNEGDTDQDIALGLVSEDGTTRATYKLRPESGLRSQFERERRGKPCAVKFKLFELEKDFLIWLSHSTQVSSYRSRVV